MKKLKQILDEQPMLNQAEVARAMYPGVKSAPINLSQKFAEKKNKSGGTHRMSDKDERIARETLGKLGRVLVEYSEQQD